MIPSLEQLLRPLAPSMPAELISAESLAEIGAIARVLPNTVTSFFGFECRLGETAPRADFLLSVLPEPGGAILAGRSSLGDLPEGICRHPVWSRLRAFCSRWTTPGSPLHDRVENIWLEFDVEGSPLPVPVPSVFFGPRGGIGPPLHDDSVLPSDEAPYRWLTREGLASLLGRMVPSHLERGIFDCLDALPAGARVFQVGAMLARPSDAVRLCIAKVSRDQIGAYLHRVRWPGSADEIRSLLTFLGPFADFFVLDIDVEEGVRPKIGLECYIYGFKQPAQEPRWQDLLDALVEQGLCVPAKRDALLTWPGFERADAAPDLWPGNLLLASRLLGPRVSSALSRTLHHVKISHEPGRPLEAKAYLGIGVHWLGARALQEEQRARL
jgi:hypothetical protein